ncbi:hypothetical protein BO99DRAFT_408494 [Aspergillus violaceofuscus CBS 115571]|uniref:Uncharacterized protein n=1 Tax=Aspergillus violaceofuscus (strain CBS 115571) TaxID=1450538 RepID=A0A2V5I7F6_ASPV1|nr:hypothetical protein BO99DRAFT_408494 [Aspergillus violaceofuscus CBS 115571]
MKLIATLIATTLALAASVQAADCTTGLNYCSGVLDDVDPRYNAIMRNLIVQRNGQHWWTGISDTPDDYLYHCESGGQITIVQDCQWGCVNAGAGSSDYCRWA